MRISVLLSVPKRSLKMMSDLGLRIVGLLVNGVAALLSDFIVP